MPKVRRQIVTKRRIRPNPIEKHVIHVQLHGQHMTNVTTRIGVRSVTVRIASPIRQRDSSTYGTHRHHTIRPIPGHNRRSTDQFSHTQSASVAADLIAQPDHIHNRDTLMLLLWPEETQAIAQRNLRQTLYHLRKALPNESEVTILSDRQSIWLILTLIFRPIRSNSITT